MSAATTPGGRPLLRRGGRRSWRPSPSSPSPPSRLWSRPVRPGSGAPRRRLDAERGGAAALGDRLATTSSVPRPRLRRRPTQVPTRTTRLTPSSARSPRTSAALGPPMPVAWMVSRACRRRAEVAPEAPGVVAHLRLLEQLLGQQQGPAGVADQDGVGGDRSGGAQPRGHGRTRAGRGRFRAAISRPRSLCRHRDRPQSTAGGGP